MRSLNRFNKIKEKSRKSFLKKHGIEPCNKANCKLCKPHKTWKKYSKFFNRKKLMENIEEKQDLLQGLEDHLTRTSEIEEEMYESNISYVKTESGTEYMILNKNKDEKEK